MRNYIWDSPQNIDSFFDELEENAYKHKFDDDSFYIKRISNDKFRIEYHKSPIQNFFKRFLECKIEMGSSGIKIVSKFHLGSSIISVLILWILFYTFGSAEVIWDLSKHHSFIISVFTFLILLKIFAFSVIIILNAFKGEPEKKILKLMNEFCISSK